MDGISWSAWVPCLRLTNMMLSPLIKIGSGLVLLVLTVQTTLLLDGARDIAMEKIDAVAPVARDQTWPLGKFVYVRQQDNNSETAINLQSDSLDAVIPDWYYLSTGNCSIDARVYPRIQQAALENNLKIYPEYKNFDFNGVYLDQTSSILIDQNNRQCIIGKIVDQLKNDKASGLVFDFVIPKGLEDEYIVFVKEAYVTLQKNGLALYLAVNADDENLYLMPGVCDGVIVEFFHNDEVLQFDQAPAPLNWFKNKLQIIKNTIPEDQLIIALGQFGIEYNFNDSKIKELSFSATVYEAKQKSLNFKNDNSAKNLTAYNYKNRFWLLGPEQFREQLNELINNDVKGVAVYYLGAEHPYTWLVLNNPDVQLPKKFDVSPYPYYQSTGEIFYIKDTPAEWGDLSHGYVMARFGPSLSNKSAYITFDDGPDPKWTPLILDLLKKEQVPATFFVLGKNIEYWPDAAKLLDNPLFTVGNHSYDHPHLDQISDKEIFQQTASTTSIIEQTFGVKPMYFRLTFDVDTTPTDPKIINAMKIIEGQGYVFVGAAIDSRDWDNPDVDEAVDWIMANLKNNKHIIVFHDGGGDRSKTIDILKKLIPRLRDEGYELKGLKQDNI